MPTEIEELLKHTMGLDAHSIGVSAIERAVQQRLAARALRDVGAYVEQVRSSAGELQELVEAVVVPETWFFRDREAFVALARMVYEDWLPTHPEGVLRLLSLPCSTGEEPYSIAMALLDAGIPGERFRIDAVDISGRALAHARHATYGKNSFRGGELEFRDRHFTATATGWQLAARIRQQVQFHHGNLMGGALLAGAEPYDGVFCRNLLIYFDRATQDRAIAVLSQRLAPCGWLFVGPSETGLVLSHGFVSAKRPMAFAFRPASAAPRKPVPSHPTRPARFVARVEPKPTPPRARPLRPVALAGPPPPKPPLTLDQAIRLADQGHLVEAASVCETHLGLHGPSAKAYYVIGLVRDATGLHADAAGFYRKALYLDPQHHETLVHLAVLLETQGDLASAKVLNDRARRLEQKRRS